MKLCMLAGLSAVPLGANAADIRTSLMLNSVGSSVNPKQQFPGANTERNEQWLSSSGELGPVQFHLSAVNQRVDGASDRAAVLVEELFLEKNTGDWDLSLGVKRLDWGVGYGYRPLSLFDSTDRLGLTSEINPGVALASVSNFAATDAWTVLCASAYEDAFEYQFDSQLRCAIRVFALVGDWDLQGIVSRKEDTGLSLGGSFSTVVGDSTEFHGSANFSERKAVAASLPPDPEEGEITIEALLGVTYTTEQKVSLIGELWRDETLATSIGEPSNYVMARLAYLEGSLEPSLTILHTPEDDGMSLTLDVTAISSNGAELSFGLREYTGSEHAFYSKLADKRLCYVEFNATF